eukprot:TRINITY_DN3844_c0_g1_i1.p1 TRINITY_DN3844_c0_g1~~TRINITY_DN3844_c0_g1_i1.p1  ORF type:complete len:779 (-),score=84.27 TRINITY_DN3844_c0_g1_i1:116-2410(-)
MAILSRSQSARRPAPMDSPAGSREQRGYSKQGIIVRPRSARDSAGRDSRNANSERTPPPSYTSGYRTPTSALGRSSTPTRMDRTPDSYYWDRQPTRDRTPTRSQHDDAGSVRSVSQHHASQGHRHPDDSWMDGAISHSAARADRDRLYIEKSVDSRHGTFPQGQRNAEYHTEEHRRRHRHHVDKNTIWDEEGYAGKRHSAIPRLRGKRTFYGAPHVQDTPEMVKLVCGSSDLSESIEAHERSLGDRSNFFEGMAGKCDQDDDCQDSVAVGKKTFFGAPHVQDTQDIQSLIIGSSKLQDAKDDADEVAAHVASKKTFFGAPHVQDTHDIQRLIVGSSKLQDAKDAHERLYGDRSHFFDGMAGRSDQADDADDAVVPAGKKTFFGAPHVQDTHDIQRIIVGSSKLQEAKDAHERTFGDRSRFFDGMAGRSYQAEDADEGGFTKGKKTFHGAPRVKDFADVDKALGSRSVGSASTASTKDGFTLSFEPEIRVSRFEGRKLPTIFVSHGEGPMPLMVDARKASIRCLTGIPSRLGLNKESVRCVLVISAHWETANHLEVTMQRTQRQSLLYDYRGAPPELYELHRRCHPPGDPEVTAWVTDYLRRYGLEVRQNSVRHLDHGVFVPLLLLRELTNLPVVQLSLPALSGKRGADIAQDCLDIGRALEPLRSRGVLILGSGMATNVPTKTSRTDRFVQGLAQLCCRISPEERYDGLVAWTRSLPHAREVHGREEHLLPLLVAAGAAPRDKGEVLGDFRSESGLAMTHFAFG